MAQKGSKDRKFLDKKGLKMGQEKWTKKGSGKKSGKTYRKKGSKIAGVKRDIKK